MIKNSKKLKNCPTKKILSDFVIKHETLLAFINLFCKISVNWLLKNYIVLDWLLGGMIHPDVLCYALLRIEEQRCVYLVRFPYIYLPLPNVFTRE